MRFSPIPRVLACDIFAITPEWLRLRGIRLLLLDLDNTLAPYAESAPRETVLRWMNELRKSGIESYLLSNNSSESRVADYAAACGIEGVHRAGKPHPRTIFRVLDQKGLKVHEAALMGDQCFTDGLAANRAGILSIVVRPLEMNIWYLLRYWLEHPFRWLRRERVK